MLATLGGLLALLLGLLLLLLPLLASELSRARDSVWGRWCCCWAWCL